MNTMKEYPILFSTAMVQAILAGKKTQTRRVFNVKSSGEFENICRVTKGLPKNKLNRWGAMFVDKSNPDLPLRHFTPSPYGGPGDWLWVRETWWHDGQPTTWPHYHADGEPDISKRHDAGLLVKKPSIHMPKKFCRIWLKVIGIRVERLHEITEADAIAEGCPPLAWDAMQDQEVAPSDWFRSLWDRINAARGYGWDTNPWVWVVEFERVDRPQAALGTDKKSLSVARATGEGENDV